ncbi:MAG: hypothetical protein GKR89_23720 [Candidatus Latescibacteria bacterium]|nr:hypothetical protein [Candidatus Latescibacterota bacterium]
MEEKITPLAERLDALSQEQIQRYWRDGFLVVESLFEAEFLEQMRTAYEAVCQQARASGQFGNFAERSAPGSHDREVMSINQVCERSLFFHRLLYDPRILDIVEELMGPNIQLFHDFTLRKPARTGGGVFWHQDNQAWQSIPPNNLTCWIALDDADADNGALRYLPGSHRQTLGMGVDADGRLLDIDNLVAQGQPQVAAVKAGGAVFHHCLTLHHSTPNHSDRIRRAHSIIFMQPGTRCGRKPPFNTRPAAEGDGFSLSYGHPLLRVGAVS